MEAAEQCNCRTPLTPILAGTLLARRTRRRALLIEAATVEADPTNRMAWLLTLVAVALLATRLVLAGVSNLQKCLATS